MNYLHIILLNERNSYNLFKQLFEYCDMKDHTFLVADFEANLVNFPKLREFTQFKFMDGSASRLKRVLDFYRYCNKADHIILNSLLYKSKYYALFFYVFRKFLKKATWIEWGKDLYEFELPPINLKNRILNHINYTIRNDVKNIGVMFQNDEQCYREKFPESEAKCFYTPFPFGEDRISIMEEATEEAENEKSDTINILVSHNAIQSNNHFNTLFKIRRFADKDIRVYLPLGYNAYGEISSTTYKKNLATFAKQILGDKVKIINKPLPIEEYIHFLAKMDIAIFDSERPIGMSSTYYLMYMGKKVFLSGKSMHTKYFKENGYNVSISEDIDDMTWKEFVSPCIKQRPKELEDLFVMGKSIMHWQHLFDVIKDELNKNQR